MATDTVKKDRLPPLHYWLCCWAFMMFMWAVTEMDLQDRHAKWDKEIQAVTLYKHRAEFNTLSTASEITALTEKYYIESLLEIDNPVFDYCKKELLFSFILPSCGGN